MNKKEFERVRSLSYLEYCDYLQDKYGIGLADYMTKSFNPSKKCKRTKDGLIAHHKMEDHATILSTKETAQLCPIEWQSKENIVYCDYLEHLLLHVKITIYRHHYKDNLGIGGVYLIASELNDLYSGWQPRQEWRKTCCSKVINDKEIYFEILKDFLLYCIATCHKHFSMTYLCSSYNNMYGTWPLDNNQQIFSEIRVLYKEAYNMLKKETSKQIKGKYKNSIILYRFHPFVKAVTIDEGLLIILKIEGYNCYLFYRGCRTLFANGEIYVPKPSLIPHTEGSLEEEQLWLYERDDKKTRLVIENYYHNKYIEDKNMWFKPVEIVRLDELGDYRNSCYKESHDQ